MASYYFVSTFVIVLGVLVNNCMFAQEQNMHSVYKLDFLHAKKSGVSDHAVARYWVNVARLEYGNLYGRHLLPDFTAEDQRVMDNLETALSEILELGELLDELPPGPEREKMTQTRLEMGRNTEIARSVFEILGVERCVEYAINRTRRNFDLRRAINETTWSSIGSYFKNETFLDLLNLTDAQKKSIESETVKAVEKLEKFVARKIAEQQQVSDRRWQELLAVLEPEQRTTVKQLIGRPVEWFRIPKNNSFDGITTWLPLEAIMNGHRSMKVSSSMQMSAADLKQHDIELMDSLVYSMLYAAPLWPEYELIESQEAELSGSLRKHYNEAILTLPDSQRLDALLGGDVAYNDSIKNLLLPKQLEWFQQIELQIRLEKQFDPYVGLLNPKMIDCLALSSDQRARIQKIGQLYLKAEKEWQGELESENKATLDSLHIKISEILTEEQKEFYKKYTGESLVPKSG